VVNYHGNFNPTISRVKIMWKITTENYHGILSSTLKADYFLANVVKQYSGKLLALPDN